MKWIAIAKLVLPFIAAFVPQAKPLLPFIEKGLDEAEVLHGDDSDAKEGHVYRVVENAVNTKQVLMTPEQAVVFTDAIFNMADSAKTAADVSK